MRHQLPRPSADRSAFARSPSGASPRCSITRTEPGRRIEDRPFPVVLHFRHSAHGLGLASAGWANAAVASALDRLLCQTCAATAAITMMPPAKLMIVGTSPKHTQIHATARGVSSVLINAFSVADIIWPPIVSSMRPRPNCMVPNRNNFSRSIAAIPEGETSGQTRIGHSSADMHAAGNIGVS